MVETPRSIKQLGFKTTTMIQCPCGQWCMLGETEQGRQGILHHEPMCEQFRRLDPLQFIVYVRHFYEKLVQPRRRRRKGSN